MLKSNSAAVFAALGDQTRLELISRISGESSSSITQLASGLNLSHQGITKHLGVLEQAGLVRSERVGREKRYIGRTETINEAKSYLENVTADWDVALQRLKELVEE